MKKLSFFLMAMLFSMMSFAQTVLFTQTYPGSPSAWTNAYTNSFNLTTDGYKLTYNNINNGKKADGWTAIRSGSKRAASVATILSEQIAKPIAKVAINFTQVKASSTNALYLEVSATDDFASATKIEADIAKGTVEFAIATPAANQYYRVTIDQALDSDNGFNRWDKVIFYEGEAASGDVEIVAAPEYSVANANFTTPFTLEITSAEGTTLKYTLDNTDPNTSATAVEVATNKTTVEIAKSTVVKAIAIKGELVSVTKTKTYSYVNTPETAYTVAEAIEVINSGLGLDNELYAKGEIYKIDSYNATYKSITYWIKDEANNQLQVYSGRGLNNTDFASKDDLVVGSKVVICGILKKYNSTYEFDKTNYIVSLELPVVNHTITVSANPAEAGTVTGAGEYEEGATATLTATANEGYEFVNWTENEEEVSTDAEYTFEVLADRALVANFKAVEPVIEWIEMELEIANLTTEVMEGDKKYLQLMGRNDMENADVTLFLNDYADVDDDYEVNAEYSYMTFGGLELTVIEGVMTQTTDVEKGAIYTGTVRASVTDEEEGGTMYLEFALTMYAAPTTVLVLTDAIVAINEELGTLTFNVATEEGGYYAELAGYTGPGVHEGPQICLFETPEVIAYATYVETEVVDGVITLTGEFISPYGAKFDLTISGKLPVVEPTTITWELNGGEFPAVVVPTNEELAMAFKQEYAEYFAIEGLTDTDMNREVGNFIYVTNSKGGDAVKFITENATWKWLHDYILTVAGNIPEGTNVGYYWRANIDGFFHCKNAVAVGGVASADFTEAGKPEAWGAAYEAEYGVVLPTEPVAEDYVLPTPVKEGYTFVGWYDNADGEGEAMTVIPAGWAGTLYAIWEVEGPATALENIAVEGKAVKAIINGQLIIIKNGVQYNAQGQVVK